MFYDRFDFFERQVLDDAGYWAVRLQQLIISMFMVSFFSLLMSTIYGALLGEYYWSFYFDWWGLLVLIIGFYAAYHRSQGLLMVFLIFMGVMVVGQAFGLMWGIIYGAATHHRYCYADGTCYTYQPGDLAVYWLYLVFAFVWWSIEIYSIVVAVRLRKNLSALEHAHLPEMMPGTPIYRTVYSTQPPFAGSYGTVHQPRGSPIIPPRHGTPPPTTVVTVVPTDQPNV